jgi:hypothetical protein
MLAILKTFERQGDIEEERKGRVDECRGKRPRKEGFGSPKPRLGFASSAPHFPHTFGNCYKAWWQNKWWPRATAVHFDFVLLPSCHRSLILLCLPWLP